MKFAKHLAKAMDVSDPEWFPYWINYKHLKKFLKFSLAKSKIAGGACGARAPGSIEWQEKVGGQKPMQDQHSSHQQQQQHVMGRQETLAPEGLERPWKRLRKQAEDPNRAKAGGPPVVSCPSSMAGTSRHRCNNGGSPQVGPVKSATELRNGRAGGSVISSCWARRASEARVPPAGVSTDEYDGGCPFFSALLREVEKCSTFFLQNEEDLKVG